MDIQENISLAQYTSFGIGGPARYFCKAQNKKELLEALQMAEEKNAKVLILGGGTNVLCSDEGFDGMVILVLGSEAIEYRSDSLRAYAGLLLIKIVLEGMQHGFDLAPLFALPGTVGGAMYGNAGTWEMTMSQIVQSVEVWDEGDVKTFSKEQCKFAYRESIFKRNKAVILDVELAPPKSDIKNIENKIQEIKDARKEKHPWGKSAGCFFRNPGRKDSNLKSAGWYLEQVGAKGMSVGDAYVSDKHANFLMNRGEAKAEDVVRLKTLLQEKVKGEFGIGLEEEVRIISS